MYSSYENLGINPEANRDIMNVTEIKDNAHKRDILRSNRLVCIDIGADWCGPCKQTASSYADLASLYTKEGLCAVVKRNYDSMDQKEIEVEKIGVVPVFQFYVDGIQIDEIVGADIPRVEEKIAKLLNKLETKSNVPTRVQPSVGQSGRSSDGGHSQGPSFQKNSIRNTGGTRGYGAHPDMDHDPLPYQNNTGNYDTQQRYYQNTGNTKQKGAYDYLQ